MLSIIEKVLPMLLAHEADSILTKDGDSDHPILFEAAKLWGWEELSLVLRAAIDLRHEPAVGETSDKWPARWKEAVRAQSWEQARGFILNGKDLVLPSIEEKIRWAAPATLAEKYIESIRSSMKEASSKNEKNQTEAAGVPRDCRKEGIKVDIGSPRLFIGALHMMSTRTESPVVNAPPRLAFLLHTST
ncbi:hypothetical protein EG328_000542 [Venturia inaequalis]|uniref:Uncharacterized protein n=1 Tax=Venturia inaequalis TaxID=5025 RepID=A0A8H3VIG4_VENIN|nr:hypothetical protein EG328_000542 [Venturia inaequalis]